MEKQICEKIVEQIKQGDEVKLSFKELSWLLFYLERTPEDEDISFSVHISNAKATILPEVKR